VGHDDWKPKVNSRIRDPKIFPKLQETLANFTHLKADMKQTPY
jgi:hypothetical protein